MSLQAKGVTFEKALAKIDEAFGSIAEYKRKVSDLVPQSSSAGGVINDLVTQVDNLKQSYRQVCSYSHICHHVKFFTDT